MTVDLDVPADGVVARSMQALAAFPADATWVLVGGVAVFIRLGSVTRPTADADTVARSQRLLVERLSVDDSISVLSAGKLLVPTAHGNAKIDVMDLGDVESAPDEERRMFALARSAALTTAQPCQVRIVSDDQRATIPVASIPALVTLKTVSMVRRPHGATKLKVGSDIHDLVRLVATGPRQVADGIALLDRRLATWTADRLRHHFGDDVGMTLKRLRTMDRSTAAQALSDDQVASTVVLADLLEDRLTAK